MTLTATLEASYYFRTDNSPLHCKNYSILKKYMHQEIKFPFIYHNILPKIKKNKQ